MRELSLVVQCEAQLYFVCLPSQRIAYRLCSWAGSAHEQTLTKSEAFFIHTGMGFGLFIIYSKPETIIKQAQNIYKGVHGPGIQVSKRHQLTFLV